MLNFHWLQTLWTLSRWWKCNWSSHIDNSSQFLLNWSSRWWKCNWSGCFKINFIKKRHPLFLWKFKYQVNSSCKHKRNSTRQGSLSWYGTPYRYHPIIMLARGTVQDREVYQYQYGTRLHTGLVPVWYCTDRYAKPWYNVNWNVFL